MRLVATTLLLLFTAAPCPILGQAARNHDDNRTIASEITGGRQSVPNATLPSPASALPELRETSPVGCDFCEGVESFGSIRDLVSLPDGGLVVIDRVEPTVRVFDGAGRPVRGFGRNGGGPGEFGFPSGAALLNDSTLLIGDFQRRQLHLIGLDGTVGSGIDVHSTVMSIDGSPGGEWIVYQIAEWAEMTASIHLLSGNGTSTNLLPTTADRIFDEEDRAVAGGLITQSVDSRGRVALGHGDHYRILILGPQGDSIGTITRDIQRPARTDEEILDLSAAIQGGPGGGGRPAPEVENELSAARDPRRVSLFRPHFALRGFHHDVHDRLWVRTLRGYPDRTVFDLFSPDGAYLGEIELPVALTVSDLGGRHLVGVVADPDTGVERVRRWEIVER